MENYFCDKGSVDELTGQLKNFRKKMYHQEQQKRKLGEVLDNLDIFSKSYDAEYDKIQEELDVVYDRIEDLETAIIGMKRKLDLAKRGAEAIERIKHLIGSIPALFEEMTCEEKRNTYRLFIEKIEMFLEETKDGRIIKSISFKFPVLYDDWIPQKEISADETISYTLDFSEMEITSAEAKATYAELKKYIFETYGVKVSSLYIAQIKRKYGIDMGKNYNIAASPENRVPKCPKAKEEMIMSALKHFRMLAPEVKMAE